MQSREQSAITTQTDLTPLLDARVRTDYQIQPKWVWTAVASYITWATVAIVNYAIPVPASDLAILFGVLGLAGFIFSTAASYLVYLLVNRRNTHLAREEALLWGVLGNLRSKTEPGDMKTLLPLESAEYNLARFSGAGKERSALLWALLTLIPFAGWVFMITVLAFLSHDLGTHEQREDVILEDLTRAVNVQGGPSLPARRWKMSRASVPLYIIFSLLSVGVFLLAWLYLAAEDPRTHFTHHQSVEAILAQPFPPTPTGTGLA